MADLTPDGTTLGFLKSLGFPRLRFHQPFNHFDFARGSRRILVIGPMGSGKTEYSSRVWRDSQVALKKSDVLAEKTSADGADRRRVFFIRSALDRVRFKDAPEDALAYRGGHVRCGDSITHIHDSFELEETIAAHPEVGTWIIDEASFYDERLAYVVLRESERKNLVFIFPTLILNFRRALFNATASLLLELATDVFPLSAYCEHEECLKDSFYTYRYYLVDGVECPALYFDPLIIVGGDEQKAGSEDPNYCSRCDDHHVLPGKEYTYLTLKPLGLAASRGDLEPLTEELRRIKEQDPSSGLYRSFEEHYAGNPEYQLSHDALKVDHIPERALVFLYAEENLLAEAQLRCIVDLLDLNRDYLGKRLRDNRRPLAL